MEGNERACRGKIRMALRGYLPDVEGSKGKEGEAVACLVCWGMVGMTVVAVVDGIDVVCTV